MKAAAAVISASESRPPNAGMPPRPSRTIPSMSAGLSEMSSRLGPTCPLVPAACRVWQEPQLSVKTPCRPGGRRPPSWSRTVPSPPLRRSASTCLGDDLRSDEEHQHDHGGGYPTQCREDAVHSLQHGSEVRKSVLADEPQALVSQANTSTANIAPPARGSAMPGSPSERTMVTFATKAP